ncbi:MAG TPA: preprotein translocase subunit YajC [Acidimicrobiales bacterium]|jgi:preprotein translocase subunit YajC|nr:preprotein translocase subunit YajC [Acidimicrobiales bacterium]
MTAALALVAPLMGAAAKKSSGNASILFIYAAIAAAFYFLFYRPRQRKAKAARAQVNAFDVGDEVLTAGGIVGHVIDIDGDRITLETSVGASFVVLRQYVLRRLEEPVPEAEDEEPEFEDDDHQEVDEGHAAITEGSTDDDDAGDHVSGDQVEEPPAAGQGPGRNRGRSRRGKGNDGDDQTGTDGPPII